MSVVIDEQLVFSCCASRKFARALAGASPYPNITVLQEEARRIWWRVCGVADWLEAFSSHPRIGQKKASVDAGHAFEKFSHSEQSAAAKTATDAIAAELQELNNMYFDKFGFIFIICARGRSSPEILAELRTRYNRLPHEELQAAAAEQAKITEMRLATALGTTVEQQEAQSKMQRRADTVLAQVVAAHAAGPLRSPITTHVLDTATGNPAQGLPLKLMKQDLHSNGWEVITMGVTNEDGRVGNLLPPGNYIVPGRYRMFFDTTAYHKTCKQRFPSFFHDIPFYPEVAIDFEITPDKATEHYHIPLLISPYGYSTYRGS